MGIIIALVVIPLVIVIIKTLVNVFSKVFSVIWKVCKVGIGVVIMLVIGCSIRGKDAESGMEFGKLLSGAAALCTNTEMINGTAGVFIESLDASIAEHFGEDAINTKDLKVGFDRVVTIGKNAVEHNFKSNSEVYEELGFTPEDAKGLAEGVRELNDEHGFIPSDTK